MVTNGSGAKLDELRLHPIGARMNTSTYQELVGPNDQSDLNSRTAYAEYDGDKRLQLVKDNQRDIVKYYRYHYKDQEAPRWEYTGNNACVTDATGSPTGLQRLEQRDANPASASFGQTRQITVENDTDCPLCEGANRKLFIVDGRFICEESKLRSAVRCYYDYDNSVWVTVFKYVFSDGSYGDTEIYETNPNNCVSKRLSGKLIYLLVFQ